MKSLSQAEYGEIRDLYQSIYAPEQVDEEIEISEEELTEIIEEAIIELLEEGYTAEEIEESFDDEFVDEILIEAKVTYGSDTESPEEARARRRPGAKARLAKRRSEARDKKIADTKAAVKKTVKKNTIDRVNAAKSKYIDEPARKYAEKRGVVKSKSGKTSLGGGEGINSVKFKQKTSAGRRDVRKAVAKDMASNLGKRIGKALVGSARNTDTSKSVNARFNRAADKAKKAASGAVNKAQKAVSDAASGATRGLKRKIGRAARNVANKADKAASRLGEEVETYDVVVEFLCDQGIAEDLQEAQWMMVNEIDSEDIATILEAYGLDEIYKGKHGQTEKQYQDSRSDAGKMVSGDSKMSGAAYSSRSMRGTGPNPAGGSKKPEGQGRMTSGARTDLQFRKAALKKG